jgi:hypothetical protein
VVQVVHRETSVSGQTEMIHGQRAQRLDGFLVLRCWLSGMRRNLVDAIRDEEDQVDQQPVGGPCQRGCERESRNSGEALTLNLEVSEQAVCTE